MPDTVNVPFLGDQKKEYLLAGGAVALGYLVYRRYKGGGATSAVGGATATSTGLGTFAGYDATGAPVYTNAAGQTVDANGNPDTVVTPVGVGGGYSNPAPITVSGTQDTGAGSAPTTDQAWTAAVVQDLTGLAYDPQAVSAAVALYLGSQPLDTTQQLMIRTAWAYEGRPPQHPQLPIVPVQSPPGGGKPPPGGPPVSTLPTIKPGESLMIPYNVAPGQMGAVAAKFGISQAHLLSANPGVTGKETSIVVVNVPYLTSSADSLASLAAKFGISQQHLAQYVPAS